MTTAVLAVLVTVVLAESSCLASAAIWIKADSAWSVTGKDDLQKLKRLASGVGYEFEPNADTGAALKRVGSSSVKITDGRLDCDFALPPSSVSFVVLTSALDMPAQSRLE